MRRVTRFSPQFLSLSTACYMQFCLKEALEYLGLGSGDSIYADSYHLLAKAFQVQHAEGGASTPLEAAPRTSIHSLTLQNKLRRNGA